MKLSSETIIIFLLYQNLMTHGVWSSLPSSLFIFSKTSGRMNHYFFIFFLVMESDCNYVICSIMTLLYLALKDDIFVNVHIIKEIMYPTYHLTVIHVLALKPYAKRQPVLQVKTKSGWGISAKLALVESINSVVVISDFQPCSTIVQ